MTAFQIDHRNEPIVPHFTRQVVNATGTTEHWSRSKPWRAFGWSQVLLYNFITIFKICDQWALRSIFKMENFLTTCLWQPSTLVCSSCQKTSAGWQQKSKQTPRAPLKGYRQGMVTRIKPWVKIQTLHLDTSRCPYWTHLFCEAPHGYTKGVSFP